MPVEGCELMEITCRACKRAVRVESSNDLVGKQEQLVCRACGSRGADIIRFWHVGKKPAGVRDYRRPTSGRW